MNFKTLAEQWFLQLQKQVELGKMKPASAATFIERVRTHALPAFGELDVEQVRNAKLKEFAEALALEFKPKTVRECVAVVKAVLRSYVNEDGEAILDLSKWNNRFIFRDVKNIGTQHRPTLSRESINAIIGNRALRIRDRVFVALAASTGLRRGELIALRNGAATETSWDKDERAVFVRTSMWKGQIQDPKSRAGVRRCDISSSVNKMLSEYVAIEGKQPGAYMFTTKQGKPLTPAGIHRSIMKPNGIPGAHCLRRFRSGYADAAGTPRNFLSELMGHSLAGNIDEIYIVRDDVEHRRKIVEKIGTGLELSAATLPMRATNGRKNVVRTDVRTNPEQIAEPAPQIIHTKVCIPEPSQIPDADKLGASLAALAAAKAVRDSLL